MRKVAVVIKDICTYQQTPYNFKKVDIIYDFFAHNNFEVEDDNTLFAKSRKIEPPDMPPPNKKASGLFRKLSFNQTKESKEKKK